MHVWSSKAGHLNLFATDFNSTNKSRHVTSTPKYETKEPMIERKMTFGDNALSFTKGSALGLFVAYSFLNMKMPTLPVITTLTFASASVAMNYNKLTSDFKKGFETGAVLGCGTGVLFHMSAPVCLSGLMMLFGTFAGSYRAMKEIVKRTR